MIVQYVITVIFAIVFGQVAGHLNKKLPPVVAEEITYKEFFKSLKRQKSSNIFNIFSLFK